MTFTRHHAGPFSRDFIVEIVRKKHARGYLEVGVCDGSTLALVDCPSIGVDPAFKFSLNPMGKKTSLHLYQMASDEFFRDHDPRRILGGPVDVIFLDGLHQFEYLLRDFINSEAVSHRDGLIMLDDCLPVNAEMTERYHDVAGRRDAALAPWWAGDVWKLLPILKEYRPDLRVTAVETAPTGLVCITKMDPDSTILTDRFYEIVDKYRAVVMDDSTIGPFYQSCEIVSAHSILHGFDASMTIGP